MILTTYIHGEKSTINDLCKNNGLDPEEYFGSIMDIVSEVELKIDVDLPSCTAKLIEVNGRKLV